MAVALEEDGTIVYGEILIAADGIWFRICHQMNGSLPVNEFGPKYAT